MVFRVDITAAAIRDTEEYIRFINLHSHDHVPAANWWLGLQAAMDTLTELPARCPHIPEQGKFRIPLHQLMYESHRIIFRIDCDVVRVLRVYHSALQPLKDLRQRPKHKSPS